LANAGGLGLVPPRRCITKLIAACSSADHSPLAMNNFKRIGAVAASSGLQYLCGGPGLGRARRGLLPHRRLAVHVPRRPAGSPSPAYLDSDAVRGPPGSRRGAPQYDSATAGRLAELQHRRGLAGCRTACVVHADSVRAWAFRWTLSMLTRC
jgi:hypothetical protein